MTSNRPHLIFENDSLLVINKPTGMISQPSLDKNRENLFSLLQKEYPELYPLHRLDKDTSGLILFAKTKDSAKKYGEILKQHQFEKHYLCICFGHKKQNHGFVENYLKEQKVLRNQKKVELNLPVSSGGEYAKTEYQILSQTTDYSLVLAKPITGRTHQIRTHLATIRLPLVGDLFYGPKENPINLNYSRFYLHAYQLAIPSEKLKFQCPPDDEFIKHTLKLTEIDILTWIHQQV